MTNSTKRILSIDILGGLVMIIMALDHTRDYFHIGIGADPMDAEKTNMILFFTRWITHSCAPTFVFLSGISAYLSAQNKSPQKASLFLIKRGAWLIFVELIIITFGLTFNPFFNIIILQVIWAIGCSMILLGLLSRISKNLVLVIGLILFFGHNLLNLIALHNPNSLIGGLLSFLFTTTNVFVQVTPKFAIGDFYAILPWTSAMFLGYAIGDWFNADFGAERRKKYLFYTGLSLFCMFLILRYFNWYGNPTTRTTYHTLLQTIFSFLNVSKYPPSLQFYGMTLGPALMILAGIENVKNKLSAILITYGRVPFFYYILHFYIIHLLLVIVFFIKGHQTSEIATFPFYFLPKAMGFDLWVGYLIWFAVVSSLYLPCKWFSKYKSTHKQWWLSYL